MSEQKDRDKICAHAIIAKKEKEKPIINQTMMVCWSLGWF